nr:MAG TPA: hypothetical protein [Caudoviricetes sp.]
MPFTKKTWADRSVQYPGRRKLTATGTADVYDVTREEGLVSAEGDSLNAANFNNLESRIASAFASDGVHTLTHSRSAPGRFHALTGLNGATGVLSCQFKATAAFNAGDTFRVDGVTYAGKLSDGKTAKTGLFVSGALVSCIIDTTGKTVNFKAGGGYGEGDVIAAGKVEAVYNENLTYQSVNYLGTGSLAGNSVINPSGTLVYTFQYVVGDTVTLGDVSIQKTSGETVATISQQWAMRKILGFDSDGNLYAVVTKTTDRSAYSAVRITPSGTFTEILTLGSDYKVFMAYGTIYRVTTSYPSDYENELFRYTLSGTYISSSTITKVDGDIVDGIDDLCGESADSSATKILYLRVKTTGTYSFTNLVKLSATGSIVWYSNTGVSTLYPDEHCYSAFHDGYLYTFYDYSTNKLSRYSASGGTKDTAFQPAVSPRYFMAAATIAAKTYLCGFGGKGFWLVDPDGKAVKYASDLFWANENGVAFWSNGGYLYSVNGPIIGYKVLSGD